MTENPTFRLKFLGAAQLVTGSSYLLEIYDKQQKLLTLMLDHGLFQGIEDEKLNSLPYDFDPSQIDYVILTHAHADHCGRLPRLYRNGFRGKILTTQQTFELAELILFDSAKIQQNRLQREGVEPIYDANDVLGCLELFEIVDFDESYSLEGIVSNPEYEGQSATYSNHVSLLLKRAGHILGAASVHISYRGKSIAFSGDLGRTSQPLIKQYEPIVLESNFVVCESLYGGKNHEEFGAVLAHYLQTVNKTLARNGNVIIPAFSIQRAQEMLYLLNKFKQEGRIPRDVQIIFDSPLALKVTDVYTSNSFELSEDLQKEGQIKRALFNQGVRIVKNGKQYKKVAKSKRQIILTGGGMCNGGRIVGYLKTMLGNVNDTITIIGFQAEGTLGRELAEGKKQVQIDGEVYSVKASIEVFRGFSAHGDQNDLVNWLKSLPKASLKEVYLVHAEIEQSLAFKSVLEAAGYQVKIPQLGEQVEL